MFRLKKTSPQMSVRSVSRQNDTCPGLWPGVSSTTKPWPSSSPSRSSRSGSTFGRARDRPDERGDAVPRGGIGAVPSRRYGASATPIQTGTPSASCTCLEPPAWSLCTCVSACVRTSRPLTAATTFFAVQDVPGVDEDVAHEVGVHAVARRERDLPDVVGDLVHRADTSVRRHVRHRLRRAGPHRAPRRRPADHAQPSRPAQRGQRRTRRRRRRRARRARRRRRPGDRRADRRRQGLLLGDGPRGVRRGRAPVARRARVRRHRPEAAAQADRRRDRGVRRRRRPRGRARLRPHRRGGRGEARHPGGQALARRRGRRAAAPAAPPARRASRWSSR